MASFYLLHFVKHVFLLFGEAVYFWFHVIVTYGLLPMRLLPSLAHSYPSIKILRFSAVYLISVIGLWRSWTDSFQWIVLYRPKLSTRRKSIKFKNLKTLQLSITAASFFICFQFHCICIRSIYLFIIVVCQSEVALLIAVCSISPNVCSLIISYLQQHSLLRSDVACYSNLLENS